MIMTTSKCIALMHDDHGNDGDSLVGEKHGQGNPHVWMDPENAATMMRHITGSLIQIDPHHAQEYRQNQAMYLTRLDQPRSERTDRVRTLSDTRSIARQPPWPVFARTFRPQL